MTVGTTPDSGALDTLWAGLWALGGAIMRGNTDWTEQGSGRILWWKVVSGLITAAVLGEMAHGAASAGYVNPALAYTLASVAGYVGPAATIGLIQKFIPEKFIPGGQNANLTKPESNK